MNRINNVSDSYLEVISAEAISERPNDGYFFYICLPVCVAELQISPLTSTFLLLVLTLEILDFFLEKILTFFYNFLH